MLKRKAFHWLGNLGAGEELWDLYRAETSDDLKRKLRSSIFRGLGESDLTQLILDVDRPEEVRVAAIKKLGQTRGPHSGPALVDLYHEIGNRNHRMNILEALAQREANAGALEEIARNERNESLRSEARRRQAEATAQPKMPF